MSSIWSYFVVSLVISGLQLSTIILPNRLTITDRGVTHIQGNTLCVNSVSHIFPFIVPLHFTHSSLTSVSLFCCVCLFVCFVLFCFVLFVCLLWNFFIEKWAQTFSLSLVPLNLQGYHWLLLICQTTSMSQTVESTIWRACLGKIRNRDSWLKNENENS